MGRGRRCALLLARRCVRKRHGAARRGRGEPHAARGGYGKRRCTRACGRRRLRAVGGRRSAPVLRGLPRCGGHRRAVFLAQWGRAPRRKRRRCRCGHRKPRGSRGEGGGRRGRAGGRRRLPRLRLFAGRSRWGGHACAVSRPHCSRRGCTGGRSRCGYWEQFDPHGGAGRRGDHPRGHGGRRRGRRKRPRRRCQLQRPHGRAAGRRGCRLRG